MTIGNPESAGDLVAVSQEQFEQLQAAVDRVAAQLQEQMQGGTEVTPIGLKQRMVLVERTIERIDGDGELRQLLAVVDPKDIEQIKLEIALLKDNMIPDGQTMKSKVDGHDRIFWHAGLLFLGAIVTALCGLIFVK